MSMNTYVQGGKPADEEYKKMAKVWDACDLAGIDIPDEVYDFFDGEKPDGKTMWVDIKEFVTEESFDGEEVWTVDVSKLPKDIKLIQFANCY